MGEGRSLEGKEIEFEEGVTGFIRRDRYNALIGRREIDMEIRHMLKPTPARIVIRLRAAEALGVGVERVYVRSIKTRYGIGVSDARIHVYGSKDRALEFEPRHIVERNGGVAPFEE